MTESARPPCPAASRGAATTMAIASGSQELEWRELTATCDAPCERFSIQRSTRPVMPDRVHRRSRLARSSTHAGSSLYPATLRCATSEAVEPDVLVRWLD